MCVLKKDIFWDWKVRVFFIIVFFVDINLVSFIFNRYNILKCVGIGFGVIYVLVLIRV